MVYINTRRRHNEDSAERQEQRAKASRYESARGPFIRWAETKGLSSEQIEKELKRLDALVEHYKEASGGD